MRSHSRVPAAVACSAFAMACRSEPFRRSRRPITSSRTPLRRQRSASLSRYRASRRIRASISRRGRRQLSEEKANRDRMPIPASGAASTMRLTVSTPARWPASRGKPRPKAHRPLPSMMIPECRVLFDIKLVGIKKDRSAIAHGLDEGFHVVQVALQRLPPGRGEAIFGSGHPALEGFGAGYVGGFLQLARVHAEVAVGGIEQFLELVKGERLVDGERAEDPQAQPLVNQPVEPGTADGGRNGGRGRQGLLLAF